MTDIDRLRELTRRYTLRFGTHYEGCEADHAECLIGKLADALAAAERERDELIHDIERHVAIASREAEARIQAERERDAAYETAANECDELAAYLIAVDNEHDPDALRLMNGTCIQALRDAAAAIRALQTHKGEQ